MTTLDEKHGEIGHRHPRFLPDGVHFLFLVRAAASGANAEKNRVMVGSLVRGVLDLGQRRPRVPDRQPGQRRRARLEGPHRRRCGCGQRTRYLLGQVPVTGRRPRRGDDRRPRGGNAGRVDLGRRPWYQDPLHLLPRRRALSRLVAGREAPRVQQRAWRPLRHLRQGRRGRWGQKLVLADANDKYPSSWTPDGRSLLFSSFDGKQYDVCIVPFADGARPEKLVATSFDEAAGTLSPDGHWLAYQTNQSGRTEVYVTFFPRVGRRFQVSLRGGTHPRWRRDGRELYYVTEDGEHMAATVDGAGGTVAVGQVAKLFDGPYAPGPYRYDAAADGKRFLVVAGRPLKALPPMNLVLNWPSGIERR